MDDCEKQRIKELWDCGVSMIAIAHTMPYKVGRAIKEIKVLREEGFLEGNRASTREKTTKNVLTLFRQGLTVQEISQEINRKPATIREILHDNGENIPRPTRYKIHNWRGNRLTERSLKIIEEIESGRSAIEVANEFGLSKQRVYAIIKRKREADYEL